jgi:ketol-acid reductoisomerase
MQLPVTCSLELPDSGQATICPPRGLEERSRVKQLLKKHLLLSPPTNIGIIGAGHIGSTLALRLTSLGHSVLIANSRGPETLTDVAQKTGATPTTAREAARHGDLIVVTIP